MTDETRLKRLYFRSAHRGSKETDLILGPYAAQALSVMSAEELDIFEAFLEESDNDIWDWVAGRSDPGKRYMPLVKQLQSHD